jgi:hypothetical protein
MFKFIENSQYQINEEGIVKREYKNGKVCFLKMYLGKNGYYNFTIENRKKIYLHRALANCFIPNPNNLRITDHINRNRQDNRLENLRWVNDSDNSINRKRKGCISINKCKYKDVEYNYYRVFWTLPNEKEKSKSFKTKEEAQIFLDSLELHKY